jgi:NTE family protein
MSGPRHASNRSSRLALILSGGGARAAYQVGFLSYLAQEFPEVVPPIVTGVSAGAVNAAYLASHVEPFPERAHGLRRLWMDLEMADVFRVDARHLSWQVGRWGLKLVSGGARAQPGVQGLVDTEPLRRLLYRVLHAENGELPGVAQNLQSGLLDAFALTTTSYATGRSVTWVQASEDSHIQAWERAHRRSVTAPISVEHVMASAALPLFFPAVRLDRGWYGDGGIRLTAPLSPAVHLGADRILAISTRYVRSPAEAEEPAIDGYPPPVQVAGVLMNAIFLDLLDADALRLQRINELVAKLPPEQRGGMRHVELLILRPSLDLGLLASEYEVDLPRAFRFLVRGLGTHQTRSADALSLILFQPGYLRRLVALGERDARARREDIAAFLGVDRQAARA